MAEILELGVDQQAKIVLGIIKERSHEIEVGDASVLVELFINGRERGYTLYTKWDHQISFAENRNSDEIVVYPFVWGNTNAEQDYKSKTRRFWHGEWVAVADFVIAYLNEESLSHAEQVAEREMIQAQQPVVNEEGS